MLTVCPTKNGQVPDPGTPLNLLQLIVQRENNSSHGSHRLPFVLHFDLYSAECRDLSSQGLAPVTSFALLEGLNGS